ncbi:hypothetical protein PSTT_15661 [Puccinia striiformis]|uniref:Uncharacterized protein n=1 Tax=Puccinia striiformis TaxID=27350 RepID=A0A2S4UGR9_9BASI|nr:hypothetical protein PSTT_17019 [Puccinia striiformis]POV96416.1 hypothetical protein PSTT_15661 [Puccinia striiformis]
MELRDMTTQITQQGKQRTKPTRVGSGDAQDAALLKDDLKGPQNTPQVSFPDGSRFDYGVWVNETCVKFARYGMLDSRIINLLRSTWMDLSILCAANQSQWHANAFMCSDYPNLSCYVWILVLLIDAATL